MEPVQELTEGETATVSRRGVISRAVVSALLLLLAAQALLMWLWSEPPAAIQVEAAKLESGEPVIGSASTQALIATMETLLQKRGGYLSNDIAPPGAWLDDMPNFEFGALLQARDLADAMRRLFSRSLSQSYEDRDLAEAEPLLSSTNDRWWLPSSESQYRQAILHLRNYQQRLLDRDPVNATFSARADNLAAYLALVESRLGSLSQRLSSSVGQHGEHAPSTESPRPTTPWAEIDDVFYETRGSCYALALFLRAVEIDFADVLADKRATERLQQVVRELESTQHALRSPVILNGTPFGFFANHSLVMASYVSRANAGVIELRAMLDNG